MQRSNSIQIILPVISTQPGQQPFIGPIQTEQEQKIQAYYKLTKAEKKKIKKDLLKFVEGPKEPTKGKESQQKVKILIEYEEA